MLNRETLEGLVRLHNDGEPTMNGPYGDPESPVRQDCHKALIFRALFDMGGTTESCMYEHLLQLYNSKWRWSGNYLMRYPNGRRDSINGVIGPAWAIEACVALSVSDRTRRLSDEIIKGILKANTYNEKLRCWERSAPCGTALGIDTTFNHQLWYASVLLMTPNRDYARDFLEYHVPKIRLTRGGAIVHDSPVVSLSNLLREPGYTIRSWLYFLRGINSTNEKSVAYHAFNLIALARCKHQASDLKCWNSRVINSLRQYNPSAIDIDQKINSKYGDSYNPQLPGYIAFEKQFDCKFSWLDKLKNDDAGFDYLRKLRNYEWLFASLN